MPFLARNALTFPYCQTTSSVHFQWWCLHSILQISALQMELDYWTIHPNGKQQQKKTLGIFTGFSGYGSAGLACSGHSALRMDFTREMLSIPPVVRKVYPAAAQSHNWKQIYVRLTQRDDCGPQTAGPNNARSYSSPAIDSDLTWHFDCVNSND